MKKERSIYSGTKTETETAHSRAQRSYDNEKLENGYSLCAVP